MMLRLPAGDEDAVAHGEQRDVDGRGVGWLLSWTMLPTIVVSRPG